MIMSTLRGCMHACINLIVGDFNAKMGSDNQLEPLHGLGVMTDNGQRFVNDVPQIILFDWITRVTSQKNTQGNLGIT